MRPRWPYLALALVACKSEGKPPAPQVSPAAAHLAPVIVDPADEKYVMPALPLARVTLTDSYGGKHVVEAEVAATAVSRTRGLMWRTELAAGKGMLFIFNEQQLLSFWMKNTLISLDMIFIDKTMKVVGVVERAEPKTLTSRNVGAPSLYVLEVPGGWCEKMGIKAGAVVRIEGAALDPH